MSLLSAAPALALLSLLNGVSANLGLHAGDDLLSFITRPDLRPPKFNVTYHDRSRLAPGYWFVNPYNFHANHLDEDIKWMPCEAGPAIYDNNGDLIWFGGCRYANHAVFEFNMVPYNDREGHALVGVVQPTGNAFFLGDDYEEKHKLIVNDGNAGLNNLHELNILDGGKTAIHMTRRDKELSLDQVGLKGKGVFHCDGFKVVDVKSGKAHFEWDAVSHLFLNETTSSVDFGRRKGWKSFTKSNAFDPYHMNAVDRTPEGNYLVSLRHTDSIIYVNGKTGDVIWRLGGVLNDFEMLGGLAFSRQHHIRCLECDERNGKMILTMHNNNAADPKYDPQPPTGDSSNGLMIEINYKDGSDWWAKTLHQYDRPDGRISVKRGSMQILPNGNVFMGWTSMGYLSEHSKDGQVLMEASFAKRRLGTYRAYKHDGWIGRPADHPIVKAFGYQARNSREGVSASTTACYVSWNGATEVKTWEFFSQGKFIGSANRTGFESLFVAPGLFKKVVAKAIDKNGRELGESHVATVEMSEGWQPESTELVSMYTQTHQAVNNVSFYILVSLLLGLAFRGCMRGFRSKRMIGDKLRFPWMNGYQGLPADA